MINQSVNQIVKYYGPHNTVMDGAHVHVYYAPNTEETAKRISDLLGTKTEIHTQENFAGHRLAPWLGHIMVSRQQSARALLTPGEVRELPATDELVIVAGLPPIRAKKLRFHTDRRSRSACRRRMRTVGLPSLRIRSIRRRGCRRDRIPTGRQRRSRHGEFRMRNWSRSTRRLIPLPMVSNRPSMMRKNSKPRRCLVGRGPHT